MLAPPCISLALLGPDGLDDEMRRSLHLPLRRTGIDMLGMGMDTTPPIGHPTTDRMTHGLLDHACIACKRRAGETSTA